MSPPEALLNVSQAQNETLQQLIDFATSVVKSSEGEERSYALGLIFALGVSRGSLTDLLQVRAGENIHN